MRAGWPFPSRMQRRICAGAVEPRPLVRSMSVGGLPHFADPALLPSRPAGCRARQSVSGPCVGFRRMFQHAAAAVHRIKREAEAAAIIAGLVVVATPSQVVYLRHLAPELAGRMRDDGIVSSICQRIPFCIVAVESERLVKRVFHHEQHDDVAQQPHGANRSGLWQFDCQSAFHASGLFALR